MMMRILWLLVVWTSCIVSLAGIQKEPLSKIPVQQRESLAKRMEAYVRANQARDWIKLYNLVSEKGKGNVTPSAFVAAMEKHHGREFASYPDLLDFRPSRAYEGALDGFDIYGCGKAKREGKTYNGIAVVHAVFEHNDWFFTGWSFTNFPNEPCKALSEPDWEPGKHMKWDKQMEELWPPPKLSDWIKKPLN